MQGVNRMSPIMKQEIIYSLLCIFLLNTFVVHSQQLQQDHIITFNGAGDYEFYHLRTNGGMEQNSVTSIAQDTLGQIWFSTKDGLVRYNSRDFVIYKNQADNPRSIPGNFVGKVYVARNGSIWIRTNKGLSKYHFETDDFELITNKGTEGPNIFSIAEDSKELLWFPGDNNTLYCYDDAKKKLQSFKYNVEEGGVVKVGLVHILITKNDRIFISTHRHYLLEFDPENSSFTPIHFINDVELSGIEKRKSYAFCMMEDHDGYIWLATHFGFLLKYDVSNKLFTRYYYRENIDQRPYSLAMFLFEDNDHAIWVGSWSDGLFKISDDKDCVHHIIPDHRKNTSLSNNIVTVAFQDKAGYMWFGTEFAGINILKKNKKFSILSNDTEDSYSLPPYPYTSVTTDNLNRAWVGTDGGGLGYFNKEDRKVHLDGKQIIGNEIRVFALLNDSKDMLWIGTGSGLFQYDPKSGEVAHYPHIKDNFNSIGGKNVISLCEDNFGNIWIGTIHGGLTKFDVSSGKFYRFVHDEDNPNSLSYNYVSTIYCDSNNDIWVGTLDGLNKFNPNSGNFTIFKSGNGNPNAFSSNTINCLYDKDGSLWIGTKGGGLNRYDLQTKKITYYLEEDGLPSNNVRGIVSDSQSNLWISTTHNISKFNLQTKQFVTYAASDGLRNQMYIQDYGLQELEFFEDFAYSDKERYLYFGGVGGMFYFHPDSLPRNEYKPPILIDKLVVNGESYNLNGKNIITLNPNQNHIEVFLTVLNFIQPDKNQYAFFLENYDSAWRYNGTIAQAEYFDLSAGTYRFYYKGANNDGIWNNASVPLTITIMPRFYQTNVFYLLLASLIILLGLSYFLYRWHIQRQIEKQKHLMRYSQSNLDEKEAKKINDRLKVRLEKDKLFLEADLSLHKLAKVIDTKPHYLSQVINQFHHRNFHEFVNMYRIEVAKTLLTETQLKIEAIAYDSGFNSISTFNVAFKKETGLTPSEFKKSIG